MKKLYPALAALALLAGLLAAVGLPVGATSQAGFAATLEGYQEVPAISTMGTGTFTASLSSDGMAVSYVLSYADLSGAASASHIHFGQAGVNGGVAVFLCGGALPACPGAGGTVSGTFTAQNVGGPAGQGIAPGEFDELLDAMFSGVTYANVHTAMHPAGEIRGQIEAVDQDRRRGRGPQRGR